MGASNFVEGVDLTFKIIIGISLVLLAGIVTTMLYFTIRYRRSKHPHAVQVKDSTWLEITWTTIPIFIVLLMFYYGFVAFRPMRIVPDNAMQITVIGKMWNWVFEYEGIKQADTLVVPIDRPVKLNLVSLDVVHSLYIPAFRIKEDVVPGKNNYMWFIPQQAGEFDVLCSEYCGMRHSYMESKVRVVSYEDFKKWLAAVPLKSLEPEGLVLLKNNACTGCHSLTGVKLVSVSFKGLYGSTADVTTNGTERKVKVDDDYIRTSIFEPDKDIVVGYPKGVMKSYKGILKEEDVKKITEYLKTLK